ncbi:SDR family oxidoreductase [Noviherbaspirillum galbum]|uniref:SDR family oxidoreductase n=1 Tax=Noviherbaspirillum galbum TaxID=2709383 RepID=A0A6B3SV67_9BURK|nr:SDR family oxidoreductase [Noviherbaspirillum galbum]NEX62262.1 SDR family oxidoreductase [Noviherbaspirillum galbum]
MGPALKKLPQQVIVITGASSGIGLATARMAGRCGARLVLASRNESALRLICDDLNFQGVEAIPVTADVSREEDVIKIGDAAVQHFGTIDTWMNLAGVAIFGRNEDVPVADMQRLFDVNFWGVVHGSLVAAKHLRQHGGVLINMGSEASDRAVPLLGAYSASKHAVKGFTESFRVELEEQGVPVSVTLVKPASIDTMLVSHAKNYMEKEPLLPPPVYSPEVVARALLYAAENPVRDLPVGSRSRLSGAGGFYAPRILDRIMERFMIPMMKSDEAARQGRDNNLHSPATDLLESEGAHKGKARRYSVYTSMATHPRTVNAMLVGSGLALAALWRSRRRAGRSLTAAHR